MDKHLQFTNGD